MFCSSVLICKTFFSGRWWLVPSASTRWGIYVDIFICGRMFMMRKVSNNGVNAINSLKSKILIFFSFRRGTPVSFLNNKRFSARYFPVNRCFGLLWILNYFSGSGCCLGVLHHQEPGIQGGDKLLWDYKKFSNSYLFQVAWVRVETQTILTMNEHVITRNHRIKVNNNINDGILSQSNWWIVNVIKVNIK